MSHQLIQIISAGGLLAIFLTMAAESAGIPISSEIVVPLGGALAAQGKLSFVGVVVAASAGNLLGAIPWNLALAYAGYVLGQNYERVASALGPFTIPLAILVLLAIVVAYYYGRRIGEAEAG